MVPVPAIIGKYGLSKENQVHGPAVGEDRPISEEKVEEQTEPEAQDGPRSEEQDAGGEAKLDGSSEEGSINKLQSGSSDPEAVGENCKGSSEEKAGEHINSTLTPENSRVPKVQRRLTHCTVRNGLRHCLPGYRVAKPALWALLTSTETFLQRAGADAGTNAQRGRGKRTLQWEDLVIWGDL